MKRIILATIMLVTFTFSSKASFKVDDLYYNITSTSPYTVEVTYEEYNTSNYSTLKTVNIPSSVTYDGKTYSVTSIGNYALYYCSGLTTVDIPNSVTSIGDRAFYGCSGLTSVTIPNSITSIGTYAFSNCSGLTSVTFSNSSATIGKAAFSGCNSLEKVNAESIESWLGITFKDYDSTPLYCAHHLYVGGNEVTELVIPNSVTIIKPYAFRYCDGLTSVTISNSVTQIKHNAFGNCSVLASISIGNSVDSIGGGAFAGCDKLATLNVDSSNPYFVMVDGVLFSKNKATLVCFPDGKTDISTYTVPNTVTRIAKDAFRACKLTSVTVPNSVTLVEQYAFEGCKNLTSVTLPNTITSIEPFTFRGCTSLPSVNIPNTVTSIGEYAFSECSGLSSITIPKSVTSIGGNAFDNCYKLTISCEASSKPSGWSSNWNPDGKPVVWNASPMPAEKPVESFEKTGTCGDGMKWRYDTIARTMTISGDGYIDKYETIGDIWTGLETNTPWNEFSDKIKTVIVEEGVKGLGKYAFWDCDSLTTVILPSTCTDYGQSTFDYCPSLQAVVIAARNIWQANSYSFSNYDKCTLYVPKDLVDYYKKEIPFNEFSNIVGINFVKIDENIVNGTIVPERYYFKDGEQVNLAPKPKNNFIVESVIVNGDTLKESTDGFVVSGINADLFINATFDVANSGQCGDSLTWAFDKAAKKLVISGNGAMPDYTASNMPWKYFKEHYGIEVVEISQGVTAVGSNAFNGCVGLDSVFISNTVASIGSNAFSGCSSLTSVTIPNTVASIGDGAFSGVNVVGYGGSATGSPWGASKMVNGVVDGDFVYSNAQKDTLIAYIGTGGNVAIPNTVTNIGISAFYGCTALTSVIIPNSVTTIGNCAFDGCSGLTSVEIPNSVTSIGNEAFDGCKGLTSVTIPNSVTSIGKSAFYECSSLTSVSIPEGVTSIEYCAFYNCKELTSVSIPGSVTSIGDNAFEWCSKITSLTIPNGDLKSIGNFAFHACKGLTSLTIPDSVQSIGKCAFYECSGLTSITIPANLTSIGISAFYGCKGLTSVVVNMDEPLSIESSVFENVTLSNVKLFVPVGTKEKYEAADVWKDFDIVEGSLIQVALTSNDEAYGSVAGSGLYVENETIALSATPAVGCQFVKWSDGNTDNPRTITLTENVTLEAIFEKADAITAETADALAIYAHHNVIVVENATADVYVYDAMGRLIARRDAACYVSMTMQREGIYIVKVGNEAKRVHINKN